MKHTPPSSADLILESVVADAAVFQVVVGAFWTAVVLDTFPPRCGIASSMREYDHQEGPQVRDAGLLLKKSGKGLAGLLNSQNVMEASIGMAALNALLPIDEKYCREVNARELILEKGLNKNVAVIGHFPFVEQVRKVARECWILELRPRKGDLPAGKAKQIIPKAEVVALSGTTLVNHTFDQLIQLCRPEAFVVLLGGSAPLVPALWSLGVDAIAGTQIVEQQAAVQAIMQGATFRQIPGKKYLTLLKQIIKKNKY